MICFNQYLKITKNIENSHDMLKENDNEIRELAEEELKKAEGESRKLENELQVLLLPKDPSDNNNKICIIKLRCNLTRINNFIAN